MIDANEGNHSGGGKTLSNHECSATPVPAPPGGAAPAEGASADPTSSNFSYDMLGKDFFGGSFFTQVVNHSESEELLDAALHLP